MEPTTTTTPPPPASPMASGNKRQPKAPLPLGDVTNLLPNAPRNPTTGRPLPLPSTSTTCPSSASASASVTPVSKSSSAAVAEEHSLVKSAISTVYTRRKIAEKRRNPNTNNKALFPAGTASCPPLGRATRTSRKTSVAQEPSSSSVPCHQAKKKRHTKNNSSSGKPKLPEDFVKKQRAYFDEIDAFELPEEAASETDLE